MKDCVNPPVDKTAVPVKDDRNKINRRQAKNDVKFKCLVYARTAATEAAGGRGYGRGGERAGG